MVSESGNRASRVRTTLQICSNTIATKCQILREFNPMGAPGHHACEFSICQTSPSKRIPMRMQRLLLATSLLSLVVIMRPASTSRDGLALASTGQSGRTIEKDLQAMPGQKLRLDLDTGGGVTITGWQSNLVSIKAYLGGRDWQDCAVDIEQDSDAVKVTSRHTGGRNSYSTDFKFEIQVPQRFNVQIKSAGGEIAISNLDGEVKGSTGGGSLTVTEAKGTVNLTTGGGNVSVTRSEIDGKVSTG